MLDKGLLQKLLNKTLSNGGEYADVFVEHRRQTSIVLEDGKIEKVITGAEAGAGVRLIYKNRTAYAFTNDLSEQALMQAAYEVSKAASGSVLAPLLDLSVKKPAVTFDIRLLPSTIPVDEKTGIVRKSDHAARRADKRIRQVTAIYRDSMQKVQIATSEGFMAEDDRVYTTAVVQVVAADVGIIQTGYETLGGLAGFEIFDETGMEELGIRAATRAAAMLTARKAPGGRMPVVISSNAGGTLIHEAIGHGLEADLAQQGLSVYSKKVGEAVASSIINVVDDPTLPQRRGSYSFDDEGMASRRTILVEGGVLKGYLYDRLTALEDGVESTGNGRRESYQDKPIPRMSNTMVLPGKMKPEEIVHSVEKGLFVKKMGGGQVNTVNGDFIFEVNEGYLIEKGSIGEPVRGATLIGNGPKVLKDIDMVGNDLGFGIGTCGKDGQGVPVADAQPTLRIPELVVGGQQEAS